MPNAADEFLNRTNKRAMRLARYEANLMRRTLPILRSMERDMMTQLRSTDLTAYQQARLQSMLNQTREIIRKSYAAVGSELVTELDGLGQIEADWTANALIQSTGLNAGVIDSVTVVAASQTTFMGTPLQESLERQAFGVQARFADQVRIGMGLGETNDQIAKRIKDAGVYQTSRNDLQRLARTATTTVSNNARMATFEANADVIEGVEHVSTIDSNTSLVCILRDAKRWTIEGKPIGHNIPFMRPPIHYNCLAGDTNVSSRSGIAHVYKRAYKGVVIKIRTESGRAITITPNHPVLTGRGWVAAGELDCTDKLVAMSTSCLVNIDGENTVEAKFSELFRAAKVSVDSSLVTNRPAAPEDFHGDVTDNKVDVVRLDGFSNFKIRETLRQNRQERELVLRSIANFTLSAKRALMELSSRSFPTSSRVMRRFSEVRNLLRRGSRHTGVLLFAAVSKMDALRFKEAFNGSNTDSEMIGYAASSDTGLVELDEAAGIDAKQCLLSLVPDLDPFSLESCVKPTDADSRLAGSILSGVAGKVELDSVVELNVELFTGGHVYNLENKDNWYLSNGIVTHNCRSTITTFFKPWEEMGIPPEDIPQRTRASLDGQTPQETTYETWLKGRSKTEQNEILGETRANLWREDKLSLRDMVNAQGNRPLTLDELGVED